MSKSKNEHEEWFLSQKPDPTNERTRFVPIAKDTTSTPDVKSSNKPNFIPLVLGLLAITGAALAGYGLGEMMNLIPDTLPFIPEFLTQNPAIDVYVGVGELAIAGLGAVAETTRVNHRSLDSTPIGRKSKIQSARTRRV